MKKAEALEQWKNLQPTDPLPLMQPIPYKTKGSRYGACGIRVDGSPAFIDAVISNLKSLLDGENQVTRLELSRQKVDGSGLGKNLPNADGDAEVCYIRLHMRGAEGAAASAVFDKHLAGATKRFANGRGVKVH